MSKSRKLFSAFSVLPSVCRLLCEIVQVHQELDDTREARDRAEEAKATLTTENLRLEEAKAADEAENLALATAGNTLQSMCDGLRKEIRDLQRRGAGRHASAGN